MATLSKQTMRSLISYMTPVEWVLHIWAVGMIVAAIIKAV